ncbi:MAG: hypothetical protein WC767_03675 [Candidatus Paceibacterota bacterium]|jgi:hypothetical protein
MISTELAREHDDVVKLSDVMKRNWEERDREKRKKEIEKELNVDESIPASIFYCGKCAVDFKPPGAFKVEEDDWNTGGKFRYWKARHTCGAWSKRLISQKLKDPFWKLSPSVKADRARYRRDMIQPNETGFNMLYGNKNK